MPACPSAVPCGDIIVETSFNTEYFHAIRVIILRDKTKLHGTAAPDAATGARPCRRHPIATMIVLTFFVVLIPCSDSSPKLTRSFIESLQGPQ